MNKMQLDFEKSTPVIKSVKQLNVRLNILVQARGSGSHLTQQSQLSERILERCPLLG